VNFSKKKKWKWWIFGGEGFIMQKIEEERNGILLHSGGTLAKKKIKRARY
jgi:hypothetical protein